MVYALVSGHLRLNILGGCISEGFDCNTVYSPLTVTFLWHGSRSIRLLLFKPVLTIATIPQCQWPLKCIPTAIIENGQLINIQCTLNSKPPFCDTAQNFICFTHHWSLFLTDSVFIDIFDCLTHLYATICEHNSHMIYRTASCD